MQTNEILLILRKRKGMSQKVLAKMAGISQGHMSELFSGKKSFTIKQLENISNILGIPGFAIHFLSVQERIEKNLGDSIREILIKEFPEIKNL